jgi:hypothetical protein
VWWGFWVFCQELYLVFPHSFEGIFPELDMTESITFLSMWSDVVKFEF